MATLASREPATTHHTVIAAPWEPELGDVARIMEALAEFVLRWYSRSRRDRPRRGEDEITDKLRRAILARPPGEVPVDVRQLLRILFDVADSGVDTSAPTHMAQVPSGGQLLAAVGDFLARVTNTFVAVRDLAPEMVELEEGVIAWLASLVGWQDPAGGVMTTGASTGALLATLAARHHILHNRTDAATLYLTSQTHHSHAKAAFIAGLPEDAIRIVPVTADLRMQPDTLEAMIRRDHARGRRPMMIVATIGTTNTGTIDPLADIAAIARQQGVWLHGDAALGGAFLLTDRGRQRIAGIDGCDSVTIDLHKGLGASYGSGVLLVPDPQRLRAVHTAAAAAGAYMPTPDPDRPPDFAQMGIELTREARGPSVWLPTHAHGLGQFRAYLDERLDLAQLAHQRLAANPHLHTPWPPDLCTVVTRAAAGDAATAHLVDQVNHIHGGAPMSAVSTTSINGQLWLRLCPLLPATHRQHVQALLNTIRRHAGPRPLKPR